MEDLSKMPYGPNQVGRRIEDSDNYHDDMHPDHVDIMPSFGPSSFERNPSFVSDQERIVRHRKVYVAPLQQAKSRIETISIRIPLEIPKNSPSNIPDPKPIYKLKKYTTYENTPEIQMVPVTKTIIKPVGVSADQIIDETGSTMNAKNFKQ